MTRGCRPGRAPDRCAFMRHGCSVERSVSHSRRRSARLRTPQSTEFAANNNGFRAGRVEYLDGDRFARRLGGAFSASDLAGKRVLDLGCGYGGRTLFYSERYETREMVGLETTVRVVERCRAFAVDHGASTVSFVVGTAEKLPFTDGRFDAIVCFDVLEHVDDPARAFAEIGGFLRPEDAHGSSFRRTSAPGARISTT